MSERRKPTKRRAKRNTNPPPPDQTRPVGVPGHLSPTERLQAKAIAAKYDRLGYTQIRIVEMIRQQMNGLTLHQTSVGGMLAEMREEYAESAKADKAAKVGEMVQVLLTVRQEAWDAWVKSQSPGITEVEETLDGGRGGGYSKSARTTRHQVGDARFLDLVRDTVRDERDLRGLDAPKKVIGQVGAVGSFNWDEVMGEVPAEVPDTVEETIEGVAASEGVAGASSEVPVAPSDTPTGE